MACPAFWITAFTNRRNHEPEPQHKLFYSLKAPQLDSAGQHRGLERLYQLCKDPAVAKTVATVLPLRDPDLMASAKLWKFLLQDLHPDLKLSIDLHLDRVETGITSRHSV